MNLIATTGQQPVTKQPPVTMSSREIADLVEKRHDNVRRVIETLLEQGVIGIPQIEEMPSGPAGGSPGKVYHLNKRDSHVVVAQLSPEFTARLVDRWQELEARAGVGLNVPALLNDPAAVRSLMLGLTQEVVALQAKVEDMAETVAAHEHLTSTDRLLNTRVASKGLEMGEKALRDWMLKNGWVYRQGEDFLGYADKVSAGYLTHVVTEGKTREGKPWIKVKARITGKGLDKLTKELVKLGLAKEKPRVLPTQTELPL